MSDRPVFLGVDGGGTKTEFIGIDAAGREIASVKVGSTYHPEIGLDETIRRLEQGVAEACGRARVAPDDLAYVFLGLPAFGEDRVADRALEAACATMLGHARFACGNDMICGWAGSLGCEDGINIVAGTGSIGYGRRAGRGERAGGWGELFGDEGSAYWIALRGLTVFTRMSDGRMPAGPLHRRFADALGLEDDIDLCRRVAGPPPMARAELAGLAPLVVTAAEAGDHAAAAILDRAADHLAAIARAIRGRLGFPPDALAQLSWSGGVLANVAPVRSRFVGLLDAAGGFAIVAPRHPPSLGAALYARQLSATGMARSGWA